MDNSLNKEELERYDEMVDRIVTFILEELENVEDINVVSLMAVMATVRSIVYFECMPIELGLKAFGSIGALTDGLIKKDTLFFSGALKDIIESRVSS